MNIVALICLVLFMVGVLCVAFVKPVIPWMANLIVKGGVCFFVVMAVLIVGTCGFVLWLFITLWPQIVAGG